MCYDTEADEKTNNESRNTVHEMFELNGEAWLGLINRHGDAEKAKPAVWKWDRSLVYNFGAAFVCPCYDAELERLILERETAPYTGTKADLPRVNAIFERLAAIGGKVLVWS